MGIFLVIGVHDSDVIVAIPLPACKTAWALASVRREPYPIDAPAALSRAYHDRKRSRDAAHQGSGWPACVFRFPGNHSGSPCRTVFELVLVSR